MHTVTMPLHECVQVKFADDAIDETDTLEELLMPRAEILGGRLTKLVLNGNHLTPVAPVSHIYMRSSTHIGTLGDLVWLLTLRSIHAPLQLLLAECLVTCGTVN